jgi:hypothetical protein
MVMAFVTAVCQFFKRRGLVVQPETVKVFSSRWEHIQAIESATMVEQLEHWKTTGLLGCVACDVASSAFGRGVAMVRDGRWIGGCSVRL